MSCGDIFLGLIAVLFPPVAVWIKTGLCSADSFVNLLLCMLGYLPGLLHAWYIIAKHPEYDYEYQNVPDDEANVGSSRVTYYYVSHESAPRRPGNQRQYGTNAPVPAPSVPQNKPTSTPRRQGGEAAGPVAGPSVNAGSDEPGAPPSYADAVKGDHKIQRQE
ncbi:hypothetical protein H2198_003904 [Neophaeococcomyces mojaviensis]|uniref:Uncharacterized protein n=1 Tax=Neophaeococcomyces mojaviensis TaxID=3383035 RepID=A0ACC3AAC0_9EURO|nr:hypothetical protein H2198_003904 [Knufia sp. JES_112]